MSNAIKDKKINKENEKHPRFKLKIRRFRSKEVLIQINSLMVDFTNLSLLLTLFKHI